MPRSLWNGTVAFGLVRVPVKLYSATESHMVALHERHADDGAAIEHRRVCEKEDREVPYDEVVKGYEVSKGRFVVLSKEEIAAADGPGAHVIDVQHFVCREEIDPVFFDRTYYLGPGAEGDDSYRLLHAALRRSDRVGIGRLVFHNRARLVGLRALDDVIALHAMRFADELVDSDKLNIETPGKAPAKREIDMAQTLVDQLSGDFDPTRYEDSYHDAVMKLIEAKAAGDEPEVRDEPAPEPSDDLLAALEASLGSRRSSAKGASKKGPGRRRTAAKSATTSRSADTGKSKRKGSRAAGAGKGSTTKSSATRGSAKSGSR